MPPIETTDESPTGQRYAPAKVRAKFWVVGVHQKVGQSDITLSAVCRGQDNKSWAAYTPAGQITMTCLNDAATALFKPGDEFYVDFIPAPKGIEG